jgi:hypothetical protein
MPKNKDADLRTFSRLAARDHFVKKASEASGAAPTEKLSRIYVPDDVADKIDAFQLQRNVGEIGHYAMTDLQVVCFQIILQLKENAYGMNIAQTADAVLGRIVDRAQIYDLMTRQCKIGRLTFTEIVPPKAKRRRKVRVYTLTENGVADLAAALAKRSGV